MPERSCLGLARQISGEEDQQHEFFRGWVLWLYGKKPEIQLCNQADCGTGSWLKPNNFVPQRLIAALDFTMGSRNYAMSFRCGNFLHSMIYSGRDFKVLHAGQFPEMKVLTPAVGVWDNFTVAKGMDTNAWTSRPVSIPRWAVRNVVELLEKDGDLFAHDYSFRSLYDTRWETRHSKPYLVNEDQIWIVPGAGELYLGHMEESEQGRAVVCELDLRPFQKHELADGNEIRIRKKRCEFGLLAEMKRLRDFLEGLSESMIEIRHHYEER